MSSRRQARERVMKGLYAYEMGGGDPAHVLKSVVAPGLEDDELARLFVERLFLQTVETSADADSVIGQHAKNWELSRIALIDRLLLRMAISEMLFFEDIPPKVTINETIEIAKRYSTANSGKFVNGILDAILITLQQEGRLHKTGRGLIGMDSLSNGAPG